MSEDADAGYKDEPDLPDHGGVWAGVAGNASAGESSGECAGLDEEAAAADDSGVVSDIGGGEVGLEHAGGAVLVSPRLGVGTVGPNRMRVP